MIRNLTLLALSCALAFGAGVAGKWNATATSPDGQEIKVVLELKDDAGKLSGAINTTRGAVPLSDLELKDSALTFKATYNEMNVTFKLKVDGEKLNGNWAMADGSATGVFVALKAAVATSAAGVAGKWRLKGTMADGSPFDLPFELLEEAGAWKGTMTHPEAGVMQLTDIKPEGEKLAFKINTPIGIFELNMTVDGKTMKGTSKNPEGQTGPVAAEKQ